MVQNSQTVLFSAVRNEAPFLLEWIAYHRVIGFEKIIICSNDCDDGTSEILEALAHNNVIKHLTHNVPLGVSPQLQAAKLTSDAGLIHEGDWVLWLDNDEFLNIRIGKRDLASLIDFLGNRKGILINWRLFGDSGQIPFPGRVISEDFVKCSKRHDTDNRSVKTLFRLGNGVTGFQKNGVHRPLIDQRAGVKHADFLNGKGNPIISGYAKHHRWLNGVDIGHDAKVHHDEVGFAFAQVNHYFTRTPDAFWLKQLRGRGWAKKHSDQGNDRHTVQNYASFNHNEARDESILFWKEQTTAEIDHLIKLSGVSQAVATAEDRYKRKLEDFRKSDFADGFLAAPDFELTLPPDEAALVQKEYERASSILEYGSGGSTLIATRSQCCRVTSVESDWAWAANMRKAIFKMRAEDRVIIHWVDIGVTGKWGRPRTESAWQNYPKYSLDVWDRKDFSPPDVVLIDGRFRVGCFLACLFKTRKPVRILWDDYVGRDHYRVVEKYHTPTKMVGRMAVFDISPTEIPSDSLLEIVRQFSNVE